MNYCAIISSFLLASGVVLILISEQATEFKEEDYKMPAHTAEATLGCGICLTIVGTVGFVWTIARVIRKAHIKQREGHMRKLEREVHQKRTEFPRSRKFTAVSVPEISIVHVETNYTGVQ